MKTKYLIKKTPDGYAVIAKGGVWTKTTDVATFGKACKEVWKQQGLIQ